MMKRSSKQGVTVVEAVIAIAIFSIICSVGYATYLNANILSERAALKSEALWLAEEGIEATRAIRDRDFALLTAGTKGIARTSNVWQFSGTSDNADGFFRSVTLASGGTDIVNATSTVSWRQNNATSTVSLASTITNWRRIPDTATNHMTVSTTSACIASSDTRYLGKVTLTYDGAYGTVTNPQIRVAWNPTTQTLNQILSPYPTTVWTGSAATGATTTLTTVPSFTSAGSRVYAFRWDAAVTGKTFTITFGYGDGSVDTVTITNPPSSSSCP